MHAITTSRLQEIVALADDVDAAIRLGDVQGMRGIVDLCGAFSKAVHEVNGSLEDARLLVERGLRDEALAMHDPLLVVAARRLGVPNSSDWTRIYGWMLEHGVEMPPTVDLDAADALDAAENMADPIRRDLDALRRSALERSPSHEVLAILRRLRESDPGNPVWPQMLDMHEGHFMQRARVDVPRALRAGDLDALARVESAIVAGVWQVEVPEDLAASVSGATGAVFIRERGREAAVLADSIASEATDTWQSESGVGFLIDAMDRLQSLVDHTVADLALLNSNAQISRIVRDRGYDAACRRAWDGIREQVARLTDLKADRSLRRAFAEGCRRLEYLCDQPPERSQESVWLADLQRTDLDVRRCCQERPELVVSPLVLQRVQRAVLAIESRELRRRRFAMLVAACATCAVLGVTAIVGVWQWRRGDKEAVISRLESQVAVAQLGGVTKRPATVDAVAAAFPGDPHVAALVAEFDAAVEGEQSRQQRFHDLLAECRDLHEEVAEDVVARGEAQGDERLIAWPDSFRRLAVLVEEARAMGGLPEARGAEASGTTVAGEAKQILQEEENSLAAVEKRVAIQERELERHAVAAFTEQRNAIAATIHETMSAGDAETTRQLLANLRRLALSPRAEGVMAERLLKPRIPEAMVQDLDILDTRTSTSGRQ